MATEQTPMMQQYLRLKQDNPDSLLFFRLGDFYEMFLEDAKVAARELDLTLTTRDRSKPKEEQVPMCGVPYHSAEAYIARLVSRGYKVAICEQTEDPAKAKGLVDREVIRIVTPGTVTAASMLQEGVNNYMACVFMGETTCGLGFCDLSTGSFCATSLSGEDLEQKVLAEMGRFQPVEVILGGQVSLNLKTELFRKLNCCFDELKFESFDPEIAAPRVEDHFHKSLAELSLAGLTETICACGALLEFMETNQKCRLTHFQNLEYYTTGQFLELDLTARRNLELTQTLRDKSKRGSLLGVLDKTVTSMGSRLLRSWTEKPLLNPLYIEKRLDAVEELVVDVLLQGRLRETLRGITDLERIMARVVTGSANGRDLVALAQGFSHLPELKEDLLGAQSSLLRTLGEQLDTLQDCQSRISGTLVDEPPLTIREGGLIRPGASPEIDRLRDIMEGGTGTLAQIEAAERERTGIRTLKVGYNRVFGYYIELPKSAKEKAPADYIRKQTLANGERYITPGLKELESTILTAKEQVTAMEYELFQHLRDHVAQQTGRVQSSSAAVAAADALCSLAEVASNQGYCRPQVDTGPGIFIQEGRHPVVEQMLKDSLFVANDTELGGEHPQVAIITGPNMAGKSTYMRQVALIVIMAQMGSFVPARAARIGIVDRVFTRVGASDDLASGQSTFMVEMTEVAQILRHATARSLLILDEIGRGTATFDGMAIAQAVLEYVANTRQIGAKTLFATHYHELTLMALQLVNVRNYNVAVKKRGDTMIFLRKIVEGPADRSYGVEVAALAGLPGSVITRAKQLLRQLESGNRESASKEKKSRKEEPASQLSMEDMAALAMAQELKKLTVEAMTPIEAMNELYRLKKMLG